MQTIGLTSESMNPLARWAVERYKVSLHTARRALRDHRLGPAYANKYAFSIILISEKVLDKRIGTMATNKKTGKDFKFVGWVNIRLNDEHKGELEHIRKELNSDDLVEWLGSIAYAGYSFSASWDDYSDAQQVSIVCKDADDPNYGYGLSARHPDLDIALMTLRYKHEIISRGVWTDVAPSPGVDSWG